MKGKENSKKDETEESEVAEKLYDVAVELLFDGDEGDAEFGWANMTLAAKKGSPEAEYFVGVIYLKSGTDGGESEAFECFRSAAKKGHTGAKLQLAICYRRGRGTAKRPRQAREILLEVSKCGDELFSGEALFNLAEMCEAGEGGRKSRSDAIKYFGKSAARGDKGAIRALARYDRALHDPSFKGAKVGGRERKALAEAQLEAGLCLCDKAETDRELSAAVKMIKRAAKNGNGYAQYEIACRYSSGDGVAQDWEKSLRWMRESAKRNEPEAEYAMYLLLQDGEIEDGSGREWYKYLSRAAEHGLPIAKYYLGLEYEAEGADEEDEAERLERCDEADGDFAEDALLDARFSDWSYIQAANLYEEAECDGCREAAWRLGVFYETGKVFKRSPEIAARFYKEAAEMGDVPAMRELVRCYENGIGFPRSKREAEKWRKKISETEKE